MLGDMYFGGKHTQRGELDAIIAADSKRRPTNSYITQNNIQGNQSECTYLGVNTRLRTTLQGLTSPETPPELPCGRSSSGCLVLREPTAEAADPELSAVTSLVDPRTRYLVGLFIGGRGGGSGERRAGYGGGAPCDTEKQKPEPRDIWLHFSVHAVFINTLKLLDKPTTMR